MSNNIKCSKCGHLNNDKEYFCEKCKFNLSVVYQESEEYKQKTELKAKVIKDSKVSLSEKVQTLSQKYSILNFWQTLIVIGMGCYTILFIFGINDTIEFNKTISETGGNPNNVMLLIQIVTYCIVMFNSICVFSLVNFVFDLDNLIPNK